MLNFTLHFAGVVIIFLMGVAAGAATTDPFDLECGDHLAEGEKS